MDAVDFLHHENPLTWAYKASDKPTMPLSRLIVAEERDKVIKEGYAPMQLIRFETLSSKIQKEMSLWENGGKHVDYLVTYYFNDDKVH
ncbi:hypothetical protein TNCV_4710501 [Trichonephila clavipes]|uniref:Uncharacterized protein n=1 Tax=Trichonephila clavipes TaxID=2585209 RepID=A0A8X6V9X6_TRICX|nr:hypothetical protein TNCV_4710501 [Trichonephila clavipes]